MSDQSSLVEQEPQSHTGCNSSKKDSILNTLSYFAIGLVIVGLIFSAIGFLHPRDVARDPNASAQENEETELEFQQLTNALNAIIITGMILTGLGGLILSAIFTNSVVCQECHRHTYDDDRGNLTSQQMTSQQAAAPSTSDADRNQDYGTVSHTTSVPR